MIGHTSTTQVYIEVRKNSQYMCIRHVARIYVWHYSYY